MLKYLTQKEVDILHDIINSVPDSNTFIHGDIHPKNMGCDEKAVNEAQAIAGVKGEYYKL